MVHFDSALMRTAHTHIYAFYIFVAPTGLIVSEKQFFIRRGLGEVISSDPGAEYSNVERGEKFLRTYYGQFHQEGRLI